MQRENLRKLLLEQQLELTERMEKIQRDLSHRHISKKFSQQNIERENDDVLAALNNEAKTELSLINRAIKRLEVENFDHCTSCNNKISDERLEAIPYTQYCRQCAKEKEVS